jgi:hypothetical protein
VTCSKAMRQVNNGLGELTPTAFPLGGVIGEGFALWGGFKDNGEGGADSSGDGVILGTPGGEQQGQANNTGEVKCIVSLWARVLQWPVDSSTSPGEAQEALRDLHPLYHMFITVKQTDSTERKVFQGGPDNSRVAGKNLLTGWESNFAPGNTDYDLSGRWDDQKQSVILDGPCTDVLNSFRKTKDAINNAQILYKAGANSDESNNSNTLVYTLLDKWSPLHRKRLEKPFFSNFGIRQVLGYGHALPIP